MAHGRKCSSAWLELTLFHRIEANIQLCNRLGTNVNKHPETFTLVLPGERRVLRGFSLAIIFSVLVGLASLLSVSRLETDGELVAHTNEVIGRLERVMSLANDVETAGRGYIVTEQENYLQPYLEARGELISELSLLKTLLLDNALQTQRLPELERLVVARVKRVEELVSIRNAGGFEAARNHMLEGVGKQLQDAIRHQVSDMQLMERQLLAERKRQSDRSIWIAKLVVGLGCVLAVVTAFVARRLVVLDYAGSREAHAEVTDVNAQLDARVVERTAELTLALERLKLSDAAFRNIQESIVIATPDCHIVAINPAFTKVTEYAEAEVLGQHMRILQSGKHAPSFYQQMWATLLSQGHWQGEIWNRRKSGDVYLEWLSISALTDANGKVTHYIGVAADLSRMNRAQTDLERMAHRDALTGLPNRLMLMSRLEHSMEHSRRDNSICAVLFQDLDRFKQVNDTLGHAAGDELLKQVAERMRNRLREVDTVARLGGDEFVVVLEGLSTPEEATKVADQLIQELNRPFRLSETGEAHIGASIGISLFPRDAQTPQEILEKADRALYIAKSAGRNSWSLSA